MYRFMTCTCSCFQQVRWLFWMLYMPLFGLVQAKPWFRSSMWISSVAGISKILYTSEVANATHTYVRMYDILLLGTSLSWCVVADWKCLVSIDCKQQMIIYAYFADLCKIPKFTLTSDVCNTHAVLTRETGDKEATLNPITNVAQQSLEKSWRLNIISN